MSSRSATEWCCDNEECGTTIVADEDGPDGWLGLISYHNGWNEVVDFHSRECVMDWLASTPSEQAGPVAGPAVAAAPGAADPEPPQSVGVSRPESTGWAVGGGVGH